jgi:hypothetical protein
VQLGQGLLWTDDTKSVKRLSVLLTLLLVVVVGCCRVGCVALSLACRLKTRASSRREIPIKQMSKMVTIFGCTYEGGWHKNR